MIQDIAPSRLDISFTDHIPRMEDALILFDAEGRMLIHESNGILYFPTGSEINADSTVYLFSLDVTRFFMVIHGRPVKQEGFTYRSIQELRNRNGSRELFVAFTAFHLWKWYSDHRYCGLCGGHMMPGKAERTLLCMDCGHTIYPRINPAVIVGVIRGECLLITRYRRGYAHNALVAGFVEIGETPEQAVRREVWEETGLHVHHVRYYASQPWGIAQDLLLGYFCEAEDNAEIHLDENELRSARWIRRTDIVLQPNNLSLTNDMMKAFQEGRV